MHETKLTLTLYVSQMLNFLTIKYRPHMVVLHINSHKLFVSLEDPNSNPNLSIQLYQTIIHFNAAMAVFLRYKNWIVTTTGPKVLHRHLHRAIAVCPRHCRLLPTATNYSLLQQSMKMLNIHRLITLVNIFFNHVARQRQEYWIR